MMPEREEFRLQVKNLKMHFAIQRGFVRKTVGAVKAVDDVSLFAYPGETLGLVGESGCGKTTVGRCIVRAYQPTAGEILYKNERGEQVNLAIMNRAELQPYRRELRMIFQDPYASLNPRQNVLTIVGQPLRIHGLSKGKELEERVASLLKRVGLQPEYMRRYPHAFSGGQRQRIGIARAMANNPTFVVCDEPISALDVSIQAQVINLFEDLQKELDLTYLFIAHDLSMVRHISDRVAVMYLGIIVELADRNEIYANPVHPYTKALLSAIPVADPQYYETRKRIVLEGDVPSPANPPSGCRFRTRCPIAEDICGQSRPVFKEIAPGHFVECFKWDHPDNQRR